MKKLLITAAVALAAIGLNAATVSWSATSGYLYNGKGSDSTKITSGTAYLMFVTSTYTQSSLVDAFYAAKGDVATTLAAMSASGALATGAGTIGSNARITGATSTYDSMADASAYFVVFNDSKMYISLEKEALYDSVTSKYPIAFDTSMTSSSKTTFEDNAAYTSAGWYAVPEPTSGMLLLVGCALMALKRKRA